MAFALVDRWTVERTSALPLGLGGLGERPLAGRVVALLLAGTIDFGVICLLVGLGTLSPPSAMNREDVIRAFALAPAAAPSLPTATAAMPAPAAVPIASEVDATRDSRRPTEWAVVKLPPLPKPAAPASPVSTPAPPVAAAAGGETGAGQVSGSGYDPYAFASYRPPDPQRLDAAMRVARLEALIRQRLGQRGRRVEARLRIDVAGMIVGAEMPSDLPDRDRATLLAAIIGFPVAAVDPARPPGATMTVSLAI